MYCRAIACDFDGTGAVDGRPAPELYAALSAARAQGIATLLVTGRVLEDLENTCGDLSPFDAVVAENGAVVHLCGCGRTVRIGAPPPERFLGELRAHGVPFHAGSVIVGTWEQHAHKLLDLIHRLGIDGQLVFNRAALMMVPSGVNKAVGVRRALVELGRSERNLVAFGDAENDIPMLLDAEVAVAARGSVAAVTALADDRLSQPGGAGVALYVRKLLDQGGIVPTPDRRAVVLGKNAAHANVTFPSSGTNVVISGDPRSGKSWIAGLLAEQLIEAGYRICVVDPEGDYAQMGQLPRVVAFGAELPLVPPTAVATLLGRENLSAILVLSSLIVKKQLSYVDQLLALLEETRARTGCPHWVVVDEAHYFFYPQSATVKYLASPTGSFCLVTYRPSLLATEIYDATGAHLLTSTTVEEERYFVTELLQARGRLGIPAHQALAELEPLRAGLLALGPSKAPWQVFTPVNRITGHAHHARKYAGTRLPEDKAFRFVDAQGQAAHNMIEFYRAVERLPLASLSHHLRMGDFSRWVSDVIGDQQLASGLRKLERATPAGATPNREEILAHIKDRYLIEQE
ncbi:MAG TPA: HAD hydrolase family protein [Candidatus Binatia bacterium]|nr:HAD hydrolase family protein [Candidatus Binatia bacterium]